MDHFGIIDQDVVVVVVVDVVVVLVEVVEAVVVVLVEVAHIQVIRSALFSIVMMVRMTSTQCFRPAQSGDWTGQSRKVDL